METRLVKLRRGLCQGGVYHREAEIREATVEDLLVAGARSIIQVGELRLPADPTNDERILRLLTRRVVRIGDIGKIDELLIRTLSADDALRLDKALAEMDADHEAWGKVEAEADGDKSGGRS